MNVEMLINILLAGLTALVGWWAKHLQDELTDVRKRMDTYVLKEDYIRANQESREMLKEIKGQLERINDKLDRKADK